MSTPSNAIPDARVDARPVAPAATLVTHPFCWSMRRELWENRSLYLVPAAVAGVFLVGFMISLVWLPRKMQAALALPMMKQHELIEAPYDFAALLVMGAALLVSLFYCIDALYGERRDRSILFWKSLPVSDLTAVLAKAAMPIVVVPAVSFVVTMATHYVMLLLSTVVLAASGMSVAAAWSHLPVFRMSLLLLYHLMVGHVLWYAPIYAWLLLVSAWARRAPFLWATVPLLAIGVVEKVAFNSSHFGRMIQNRFLGGPGAEDFPAGHMSVNPLSHIHADRLMTSPGMWIGLAIAALFLAAAVRLRRLRGPI